MYPRGVLKPGSDFSMALVNAEGEPAQIQALVGAHLDVAHQIATDTGAMRPTVAKNIRGQCVFVDVSVFHPHGMVLILSTLVGFVCLLCAFGSPVVSHAQGPVRGWESRRQRKFASRATCS